MNSDAPLPPQPRTMTIDDFDPAMLITLAITRLRQEPQTRLSALAATDAQRALLWLGCRLEDLP